MNQKHERTEHDDGDRGEAGRLIGLDVGSHTIGVAFSDPLGWTAQASHVWKRQSIKADLDHIASLCDEYDVTTIVIGLPRRTDGTEGPEAEKMRVFSQRVHEATNVPVVLTDERFTTHMAERHLIESGMSRAKRREVIDQVAAAFILQQYIDKRGVVT